MADPSEKSSSAEPKRDKFASMAAAIVASLPDHEKLASMAVTSQSSTPSTETTTVVQHGDKLASMMAVSHPPPAAAAAAAPKRDKFASMIASAAAATLQVKPPPTTPPEKDTETLIKERMKQRDAVLKDLEQAEGWTWQLLNLASQTAISLSDLTADIVTDISETSHKYRETLQKIHSILIPHAHLVVPYRNHHPAAPVVVVENKEKGEKHDDDDDAAQEEERINMYAARVEMRLAQERRNVLKEFLRLEKESDNLSSPQQPLKPSEVAVGDKRKRDDD